MRAAVPVAAVLLVAAVVALFLVAGNEDDAYRVRAIFDNAGFTIPGEDVKIAGVKVGRVEDVEVTPDFKAAIVLRIDDPGYQDFRTDATCIARPQSLIGEKYIECKPTQAHGVGERPPGELRAIASGPDEGQRLLPVSNTQRSVDLDLINNIMREPYRQRLSIILNELGVGLAGRGGDLDAVIRRADPALKAVDDVLKLLADQNVQLEQLAVDGDTIMQPLARERRHVSSAIENMSSVAEATASRRADLEASIARLPRFLGELRPTMRRLGALSDEMTPVLADLGDAAPDINRLLLELGPFSQAGIPAVDSLGEASKIGTPAIENSLPVIKDLRTLAQEARPVGRTLADVLVSFQKNQGIERLMDYVFFQATAVNGFDSFGHYLRAGLIINQCATYSVSPIPGCTAKFRSAATATSSATAASKRDPAPERRSRRADRTRRGGGGAPRPAATPAPAPASGGPAQPAPATTPATAGTPTPTPAAAPGDDVAEPLLDYLFGGGG